MIDQNPPNSHDKESAISPPMLENENKLSRVHSLSLALTLQDFNFMFDLGKVKFFFFEVIWSELGFTWRKFMGTVIFFRTII